MSDQSLTRDLIAGAAAGAVATWVMGALTTALYEREDAGARRVEDQARHGETSYGTAAKKVARLAGRQLSADDSERYGKAIHWAIGIGTGALYGALRPRLSAVSLAGGALFGTLVWLLIDEGANTALRLTPGPTAFPWQTHARGLAAHLAYGTVANAALAAVGQTTH
jgi:hypothetical protein